MICMNFGHAVNELLEKNQKGYFDGVNCAPGESKICVKNGIWGRENSLDFICAYLREKQWVFLQRLNQKAKFTLMVGDPDCCAERHGSKKHDIVIQIQTSTVMNPKTYSRKD